MDESCELEKEILRLRHRIEDTKDREWQQEKWFLYYQDLIGQEMLLMGLRNKIMLAMNQVEFLRREISVLEAENLRFETVAVEYLKLLSLLEFSRSENKKLHKKVKKLLSKSKEHSHILRKQTLEIQSQEVEISREKKELEMKADSIRLMEETNRELKLVIEQLQQEINELSNKLRVAEVSATSKVEGETVSTEKNNELPNEVEQQQREASKDQELTHLRWSNACLRCELTRRNEEQEQEQEQQTEENKQMENNFGEIDEFESNSEVIRCNVK